MAIPRNARGPILEPDVDAYVQQLAHRDDPLLDRMESWCVDNDFPLIGRQSGRWLELLTRAIGGKRVFEFGSGFGYSAYFFARAVGPEGVVIATDTSERHRDVHQAFFAGHDLAERIDLRIGRAQDLFRQTVGDFDVVLFDVDKADYIECLELSLPRLRTGGLVLADNTLWGGRTAHTAEDDSTRALQKFNEVFSNHPDLTSLILPTGDGLGVGLKR